MMRATLMVLGMSLWMSLGNVIDGQTFPFAIQPGSGTVKTRGAYLISKINLNFLDLLCRETPHFIKTTNNIIKGLNQVQLTNKQIDGIGALSFSLIKLESLFGEIISYVTRTNLCDKDLILIFQSELRHLNENLDKTWLNLGGYNLSTPLELVAKRPKNSVKTATFPGVIAGVGVGVGLITGGIIGSMFSSNDDDIRKVNDNIGKVNNRVKVVTKKLDILSDKVSNSINNIEVILKKLNEVTEDRNKLQKFHWNVEQIIQAADNTNILFRLAGNSITLLRHQIINPELVDIKTLKNIIQEGLLSFKELEFPIKDINRFNLVKALRIIDIQDLGGRNFVALIPLVNKLKFRPFKLIPLPVNIGANTLMLAQTRDLILKNENGYVITNYNKLQEFDNNSFIVKETLPVWSEQTSNCEIEAFRGNLENILRQCNFRKLGMTEGIYTAVFSSKRILYLTEKTRVNLQCPDGKFQTDLIGLHLVNKNCDILTHLVSWNAEQSENIEVERLLLELPDAYDITELSILEINKTSEIHESIQEIIDKIPKNISDSLSEFNIEDWSLEDVRAYSLITHGITIAFMIIHAIVTVTIIFFLCKRKNGKKSSNWDEDESDSKFKKYLRNKIRRELSDTRASFRRNKARLRRTRNSFRTIGRSDDSDRSSISLGKNFLRGARDSVYSMKRLKPTTSTKSVHTNTEDTRMKTDRTRMFSDD